VTEPFITYTFTPSESKLISVYMDEEAEVVSSNAIFKVKSPKKLILNSKYQIIDERN
jgi:hypothetical protein